MNRELQQIKLLINQNEEIYAKAQLLEYLTLHPEDADAWWLVAMLAPSEAEGRIALEKALSFDSRHYESLRSLQRLNKIQSVSVPKPASKSKPAPPPDKIKQAPTPIKGHQFDSAAMNGAVMSYLQEGWTVGSINERRVVLHKQTGIPWVWAILLAALIPGVGLVILLANVLLRRRRRIVIEALDNNRITLSGDIPKQVMDSQSLRRGKLPVPRTRYMRALGVGIGILIFLCIAAIGLLFAVGDQEDKLEVGNSAYAISSDSDCVDVFERPTILSFVLTRIPVGQEVLITSTEEYLGNTWFEVSSGGERVGWMKAEALSVKAPDRRVGERECNQ